MTDTKFKSGRKKTGGRKKGVHNKLSNEYLVEMLSAGREFWQDAMKLAAVEQPVEFLKLYNEILKKDPALQQQAGITIGAGVRGFAWVETEPRTIYLKADGSEWEKDWQGNLVPAVKALPLPDTAPIINYATKTLGQDPQ